MADHEMQPPMATDAALSSTHRLRLAPNKDHKPENYKGLELKFRCPKFYAALELHLSPIMLNASRDEKLQFMEEIIIQYLPPREGSRALQLKEYREKIISNYQPLRRELYALNPAMLFVPSFIKAMDDHTESSFRSIMEEPSPGLFTFEMFQPSFCEMLISEVENFEKWIGDTGLRIMRPNAINKHGVVLDDFGFKPMLDKLVETFICPISKVFFPEVGGSTLDSHHGFAVKYGIDKDVDMRFHVDDSEVTLNVCLGKQFSGGDLFFRGARCDKHVNTESRPEEIYNYSHFPGRAVLHRGCHRKGAFTTTSGQRINLLVWCRSSIFRELKNYQKDFTASCGECRLEKNKRQQANVTRKKWELLGSDGVSVVSPLAKL